MNPNYTDFRFPHIKAHPWHKVTAFLVTSFCFCLITVLPRAFLLGGRALMHLVQRSMVQVFHKRMPPEAIDLASRLLQYSPSLRCTAVSRMSHDTYLHLSPLNKRKTYTGRSFAYINLAVILYLYSLWHVFFI